MYPRNSFAFPSIQQFYFYLYKVPCYGPVPCRSLFLPCVNFNVSIQYFIYVLMRLLGLPLNSQQWIERIKCVSKNRSLKGVPVICVSFTVEQRNCIQFGCGEFQNYVLAETCKYNGDEALRPQKTLRGKRNKKICI